MSKHSHRWCVSPNQHDVGTKGLRLECWVEGPHCLTIFKASLRKYMVEDKS